MSGLYTLQKVALFKKETAMNHNTAKVRSISESLCNHYLRGNNKIGATTPHCTRGGWPVVEVPQRKRGWKIDRGRRSERDMLSAREELRRPVSNTEAIMQTKALARARRPEDSI